jgi:PTS system fructose-specific IIC component
VEDESIGRKTYKNLMNGISHMLPFVVGGGILIAIAFLLDQPGLGTSSYGSSTPLAHFFKQAGDTAFGFMLPILAGFIAESIADRPGLAVGFVGGALASAGYSFGWLMNPDTALVGGGFLGAMLAGFVGGYLTLYLEKACDKLPAALEGVKPVLIYPLVGIFGISLVMFAVNPIMAAINTGIANLLSGMGTSNLVLLGAVVGGMMSVELKASREKVGAALNSMELATIAVSLGDAETLIEHPATMTHSTYTPEELKASGISEGLVRISVGLEDADDIIADFKKALDKLI